MHLIKLACTFVQHHNQSNQAFFYTDFIRLYGSGFKSGSTTLVRICICILGRRSAVFFFTFFSGDDDATACGSMWLLEPRCWGLGGGEELQMIAA